MLDYGLNLTGINGELGRMVELGNTLYFRKKRYVYSKDKGKTFTRYSGSWSKLSTWGKIGEQSNGGPIHIISVPVATGEIVKVTPMTIDSRVSLMTLYRNSVEQVFLTSGSVTIDWLIEVYAPNPVVSEQYGLQIRSESAVLWNSESVTLFPVVVSSPMYFDDPSFDWAGLKSKGVQSGFGRIGVILDPSQNTITQVNTAFVVMALGFRWSENFKLTSDFMAAMTALGGGQDRFCLEAYSYSLSQNFTKDTQFRYFDMSARDSLGDWLNNQVSAYRGEDRMVYNNLTGGYANFGPYDPKTSVFYGRSTGMLCYTDL